MSSFTFLFICEDLNQNFYKRPYRTDAPGCNLKKLMSVPPRVIYGTAKRSDIYSIYFAKREVNVCFAHLFLVFDFSVISCTGADTFGHKKSSRISQTAES